jgi:hypothetical protein
MRASILGVSLVVVLFAGAALGAKPVGTYSDETINLSYPMLEFMNRAMYKQGSLDVIEKQYPGAKLLQKFLSDSLGSGPADSIAYFSISFKEHQERGSYKRANDYGPGMTRVEGWTAEDIQNIAALCEAFVLRRLKFEEDRKLVKSPSTNPKASWETVKRAGKDPLIPSESAAALGADFLDTVKSDDPRLPGVDAASRKQIDDFRGRYGDELKPIAPPPGSLVPRISNPQILRKYEGGPGAVNKDWKPDRTSVVVPSPQ